MSALGPPMETILIIRIPGLLEESISKRSVLTVISTPTFLNNVSEPFALIRLKKSILCTHYA